MNDGDVELLAGNQAMATDPVCGMDVDEATAAATTEHRGTTYYFCAQGCKESFESDPSEYV